MLMSVIEEARSAPAYPELAGKRVLVTEVSSSCGVDIARAFADHKARLILQFDEMSERTHAIADRRSGRPRHQGVRARRRRGRRRGAVRPQRHAGVRWGRRRHQPGGAGAGRGRHRGQRRRDRAPRGAAPAVALPDRQDRCQPHGAQLHRGPDRQRGHADPADQRPGAGVRVRGQGGASGHDTGPGRGVGGQGHPLQRHRAADCRPPGGAPPRRRARGGGAGLVPGLGARQGPLGPRVRGRPPR